MPESENSGDEVVMVSVTEIKKEPDVVEIGDDDDISELEHLRKIFVGGLAPYTDEANLKAYFEKWGRVVDCIVMRDSVTKRSRGFGFVTFLKAASVNKAQANRPHVVDGKTVESRRALQRAVERDNKEIKTSVKKLFVGGLKDEHNEENLKEYFSKFGNVVSVNLLADKTTGKMRGFAFIEFDDYDAVDKAILQKSHSVKQIAVDVKKSIYSQDFKSRYNRMENGVASGNKMNQMGNKGNVPPINAPVGYQMPKAPQPMPYQGPPAPPLNNVPQRPPNFNYWGPPPPQMQQPPYGYQQPAPPQPPMNPWNGPPAPNNWNVYPQQPPNAPVNWQQPNQWGYGPPPNAAPPAPWNAQPAPPVQQVAPPGVPGATPEKPPRNAVTQQSPMPQGPTPNFGSGYQQNYGGGPVKNNTNSNRPNPYGAPPMHPYANGNVGPGYGGNPMQSAAPVPPVGGGYHR